MFGFGKYSSSWWNEYIGICTLMPTGITKLVLGIRYSFVHIRMACGIGGYLRRVSEISDKNKLIMNLIQRYPFKVEYNHH